MRFLSLSDDPTRSLVRLQEALDRVFERPLGWELGLSAGGVFPPVHVFSDTEGYVIRLEVPGVEIENLAVETQGNTLTVSGKRDTTALAKGSFHRRERWSGEFSRSLQLPQDVDVSKVDASYRNGILAVRIPRREEAKPRQIEVQAR